VRSRWLVAAAVAMALAAPAAAAEVRVGDIVITEAWGRASVGSGPGALYLTLRNEGSTADRLVGVDTPVARRAELHVVVQQGDVMSMGHTDAVELPPGETVSLAPGGTHIMLMGLAAPLKQGEAVPLTLHFEAAGAAEVSARIGAIGAKGPSTSD
jgi:copper(I)-binding protein